MSKNNIINKISPAVRLTCLLLLAASIIIARSIYLILFLTSFILELIIYLNYISRENFIKVKNTYLLTFTLLIMCLLLLVKVDVYTFIIWSYKFILLTGVALIFVGNFDFKDMQSAIYGIIKRIGTAHAEKTSYNIAMAVKFIEYYFESKRIVKSLYYFNGKHGFKISLYIMHSANKLLQFENQLKADYYRLKYQKTDLRSLIILILFLICFIICIIKEVIY